MAMHNKRKRIICFVVLLISLCTVNNGVRGGADTVDPQDVLKYYKDSLTQIESLSFAYSESSKVARGGASLDLRSTTEGKINFDQKRIWLTAKSHLVKEGTDEFVEDIYSPVTVLTLTQNDQNMLVIHDQLALSSISHIDWNFRDLIRRFPYPFLLGYLADVENSSSQLFRIDNFLETSSLGEIKEVSCDGKKLVLLRGIKNHYDISVWFDAERRFALNRVLFCFTPNGFNSPMMQEITVSRYCQIGEFYYPDEFRITSSTPSGTSVFDGVKQKVAQYESDTSVSLSRLSCVSFQDSDFRLTESVPNGTRVFMQDVPQIEYIWMDGKIEPKTNELMLRIAQGDHKFIPGTDEPRFWFIALGAILIVVGFTLKGRELYKKWHSDDDKTIKKE